MSSNPKKSKKKRDRATKLETTPDLQFVKKGHLNLIILKAGDGELVKVPTDSMDFLEDTRVVRSSTMDQVTFKKECVFKATLEFMDSLECVADTAVRESTDWMLCSCSGTNAYYATMEQRLVLSNCVPALQSTVAELMIPFTLVLMFEDDEWIVEQVVR